MESKLDNIITNGFSRESAKKMVECVFGDAFRKMEKDIELSNKS